MSTVFVTEWRCARTDAIYMGAAPAVDYHAFYRKV